MTVAIDLAVRAGFRGDGASGGAAADVRRWASAHDTDVSDRGRIPAAVMDQYLEARALVEI